MSMKPERTKDNILVCRAMQLLHGITHPLASPGFLGHPLKQSLIKTKG
jgi:hypothetical protein